MKYPRLYLAIDNCFASKRWTSPEEWMSITRGLGLRYVEASADNESDPLYMGPEYMADWIREVKKAEEKTGVKVANLYSGHGTYATLGLAHTDVRIRDRILNDWLKVMSRNATELEAGLGFFCHAFSNAILQSRELYEKSLLDLYDRLAQVAAHKVKRSRRTAGVEQMYSPHQVPWTVAGARELLRQVYKRSGSPFYITIDTGHQVGQKRFLKPDNRKIKQALNTYKAGSWAQGLWLGPDKAFQIFCEIAEGDGNNDEAGIQKINRIMDGFPYLFAEDSDGDPYYWLEELGRYSPIIHLQQTDGNVSSHWAFTEELNRQGIISAEKVLESLCRSYNKESDDTDLPPAAEDVYMTIEIFSATADINADIISRLEDSVAYWRNFIPEDGETLDNIVGIIRQK